MGTSWGRVALLMSAAALAGAPTAAARVDSIEVSAAAGVKGPSSVSLRTGVTLAERAFVGSVLSEGRLASCAPDYAAGDAAPRSFVLGGGFQELAAGALASITGLETLVPGGTWTVCGWVQPGGEGAGVSPSATAGPVVFTVGGPGGSTSMPAPTTFGQEQPVTVQVAYTLTQSAGQIPGVALAALHLTADSTAGNCWDGTWLTPDQVGLPTTAAVLTAPSSGTELFTGHLAPGTHTLCAWFVQDLPQPFGFAILPNLVAQSFGASTQSLTVLPRPAVAGLAGIARRGTRHRHGFVVAHYTLNVPAIVDLTLARIVPARHPSGRALCIREPHGGRRVCGASHTLAFVRANAAAGVDATRLPIERPSLAPGVYQLVARAENEAHELSPTVTATLAVTR